MIVLAALVLGIFILSSTGVLVWQLKRMDKDNISYHATKNCLIDLVTELNKRFPGSSLNIQDRGDVVKILGELKYYQKK